MKATIYITGSIAAYKAINVVLKFSKKGHEVRVAMTKEAVHLIGTQTLAALTKYPVLTDLWEKKELIRSSILNWLIGQKWLL